MHKDQALAAAVLSQREGKAAAEAAAAEQVASTQGAAVEKLKAAADREARLTAQLAAAQEAAAGKGLWSNIPIGSRMCHYQQSTALMHPLVACLARLQGTCLLHLSPAAIAHVQYITSKLRYNDTGYDVSPAALPAAWQQRATDAQDRARLEVLAARQEAAATSQELSGAQRTISSLQHHIQDLTGAPPEHGGAGGGGELQLHLGEGSGRPGSSWESRLALERRCGALEERNAGLQQQLQELSEQLSVLGEGRGSGGWGGEAAQQMAAAQAAWAQERAELERRYESKLRKMKEAARQQVCGAAGAGLLCQLCLSFLFVALPQLLQHDTLCASHILVSSHSVLRPCPSTCILLVVWLYNTQTRWCCCQQISELRDKLRSLKSSGAEMSVELGGLRVALAEREAELAAISRLAERPGTPGELVVVVEGAGEQGICCTGAVPFKRPNSSS
jgi:hypothetical protein